MLRPQQQPSQPSKSGLIRSQVSLIQASDSVRSVGNGTPIPVTTVHPVVPTTVTRIPQPRPASASRCPSSGLSGIWRPPMSSKPPVRVIPMAPAANRTESVQAFPYAHTNVMRPKPITPNVDAAPMFEMSRAQLLEIAEKQKRQIEMRKKELENRQAYRLREQGQIPEKLNSLRRDVADGETELRRLHELERETLIVKKRNEDRERTLHEKTNELEEYTNRLRNAHSRLHELRNQYEELSRRRQSAVIAALSEQRKMQQDQAQAMNRSHDRIPVNSEDIRPRASVEPFHVASLSRHEEDSIMSKSTIEETDINSDTSSPPNEPDHLAPTLSVVSRQEISPSPPKDPHPSSGSPQVKVDDPSGDLNKLYNSGIIEEVNTLKSTSVDPFSQSADEVRLRSGRTDAVSLRSDSLKATKRRSWAASEGTGITDVDFIRRVVVEQRKGKTHLLPEIIVEAPAAAEQKIDSETDEAVVATSTEESSCASSVSESSEMESTERRLKGILKPPGFKHFDRMRKIEFDPLALLLDAALEGELELVQQCAKKLPDISAANDEGITALHNAICAGHYEIVRFLIETHADVNAQDSDGWTPLHCAASCNNLPMVRQLVEGGACVHASTLSDLETPVEKCEEDEEGYDGCSRYLHAADRAAGSINNGKVYATYDYEAECEDELTFEAGDELEIISREEIEPGWWIAEKMISDNEKAKGLVPRNYLALYPALKFRKSLGFVMFEVPIDSPM